MTTWHECSGFQRDLLQAIAALTTRDEAPYGLGLKTYLEDHYDDPINHSRMYQNLDKLVEAGLITREPLNDRTNAYRLTEDGWSLLHRHVGDLTDIFHEGATNTRECNR
ncbi:PadR family transcriptional regulator [Halomicroarcula sp. F13]|uniref:PadR family transcriptional regulator n=1 Tax=Haloarcula rubra TaxID=2487747 RepID=A0AAW4PZS2_9EURY|nr:PadR family transcriptional regulator [Halomicroarcula rubra]MBX0326071.1 PadR family transcriptional regulator [Halomicroarcula rubra]